VPDVSKLQPSKTVSAIASAPKSAAKPPQANLDQIAAQFEAIKSGGQLDKLTGEQRNQFTAPLKAAGWEVGKDYIKPPVQAPGAYPLWERQLAGLSPSSGPTPTPSRSFLGHVGHAISSAYEATPIPSLLDLAKSAAMGKAGEVADKTVDMVKGLGEAQWDEYLKAQELTKQRGYKDGRAALADPEIVGHFVAALTPFAGPIAARAGEQLGAGDVSGALGTAGAVLIPTVLHGLKGETISKEVPSAETIRGNQGVVPEVGQVRQGSEGAGGENVYQTGQGGQPVQPGEVATGGQVETGQIKIPPNETGAARVQIKMPASGEVVPPETTIIGPSDAPLRKLHHEQFGEVKVQGKNGDGRLVVTDEAGDTHVIQNPRTQGNQRAAFVKSQEQPAELVPAETQPTSEATPELYRAGPIGTTDVRLEFTRATPMKEQIASLYPEFNEGPSGKHISISQTKSELTGRSNFRVTFQDGTRNVKAPEDAISRLGLEQAAPFEGMNSEVKPVKEQPNVNQPQPVPELLQGNAATRPEAQTSRQVAAPNQAGKAKAETVEATELTAPPEINPDDFLNFKKLSVSDAEKANLRSSVSDAVRETGGNPKQRITFEQIKEEARNLDPQIVSNLKRPAEGETLNPAVRYAARQRLNGVNSESVKLQEQVRAESAKANPDLTKIDELTAKANQAEADAKGLVDVLYPTRSQDGRNLVYHRMLADASWDVDHWVGKARSIAERKGQNIYSDEFQGMQRQIQETLARGKAADERFAELNARIAELEKGAPAEVPKLERVVKVTVGGWQSRFTAKLDTMEAEARARMKARSESGKMGPEAGAAPIIDDLNDMVIIGATKIARKGANLATWAQEMSAEFGDGFNKFKRDVFQRSFKMYRDERAAALDETRVQRLMRAGNTEAEARVLMQQAAEAGKERGQARQELARVFARIDKPSRFQQAIDVANAPRALLASFDLSAPLRQGAILTLPPTQWKIASKATMDMLRSLSPKQYEAFSNALHADALAKTAEKAGLHLSTRADSSFASLMQREEAFMSRIAEKIPGVAASERAYVSYLDSLRMQTFKKFVKDHPGAAPKDMQDVARFINYATGRGDLGKMGNAVAPALNAIFFSPRYLASRIQLANPATYIKMSPAARRVAMSNLMQFTGVVAGTLALAKAGGAEVGLNPDDADFLKIKVGDTRYDALAGFQQLMRFGWGMSKGFYNNARGLKNAPNREPSDMALRFLRSKLSPLAGGVAELATGKTFQGEKVGTELTSPGKTAFEHLAPIVVQDAYDAWKDAEQHGQSKTAAVLKTTPTVFGVGVQTYEKNAGAQEKAQATDFRAKAIEALRKNPDDTSKLDAAVDAGTMTPQRRKAIIDEAALEPQISYFKKLPLEKALEAYHNLPATQRTEELHQVVLDKWDAATGEPKRTKTGMGKRRLPTIAPVILDRLRQKYDAELQQ